MPIYTESNKLKFSFLLLIGLYCLSAYGQKKWSQDGIVYTNIRENLYRDSAGNIYLRVDCPDETQKNLSCFEKSMSFNGELKRDNIKDVIDTASYQNYIDFPFSKDKKHVYYTISHEDGTQMRIIEGADPETFTIVPNSEYEAKDKNAYYTYRNDSLEIVLNNVKYKDEGKGFYRGDNGKLYIKTNTEGPNEKANKSFYREVPDIDVKTYNDFGQIDGYSKDTNHVYWTTLTTDGKFITIVEKADPKTFVVDKKEGQGRDYGHDKAFYFDHGLNTGAKKK